MSDETKAEPDDAAKKKGKKGLVFGRLGAILLGGGGFFATYSGLVLGPPAESSEHEAKVTDPLPQIVFVPIDPLVISLGDGANAKYLRVTAQLDVDPASADAVLQVMPRIQDVLNTYLRAVSEDELAKSAAFDRIRAQLLRRVQVVTGPGLVRDLLITEFVLG